MGLGSPDPDTSTLPVRKLNRELRMEKKSPAQKSKKRMYRMARRPTTR